MQPFVDIANYNRGMWVSEAVTLVPVTSGLEGMSVRHGLKGGRKSPFGLSHMAGMRQNGWQTGMDATIISRVPRRTRPALPLGINA